MAQSTVDFSTGITDSAASGASGDNRLQIGDFVITITAQGNWTANFNNGQFNFAEDAAVGGENFSISITSASGNLVDLADYTVVAVHGSPVAVGQWPAAVTIDSVNWYDVSLGTGSGTYSTIFGGQAPTTPSASISILGPDYIDQTYSGTMSFTLDNLVIESVPNTVPNVVPSLTATGVSPTYAENAGAADLFSGVTAATNNTGQTFAGMRLTVAGLLDGSNETLTIGGTAIALTNGASGSISGVGSYSVSVSSGTATITLTGMTASNSAMGTLIDGLGYSVSGEDPTDGNRVVTITQLTDSGSNNNVLTTSIASTVNVNPVNDAPTGSATAILGAGTEDSSYVVSAANLLQGFSDPEGDGLSISNLTASNGASVVNNNDGTYTITPLANFNGSMTLSYSVIDGNGGSTPGTRTVSFTAVEDAPTGSATAILANGVEDTAYIVTLANLTGGFTDVDGDALTVSNLTADQGALVTNNNDGTYTITPVGNFNGAVTLSYSVTDGHTTALSASQTVTFVAANDGPTGSATAVLAHGTEDSPYIVSITSLTTGFTDIDGDTLTVSNLTATQGAQVTNNNDGTYTITTTADFNGDVILSYSVTDGHGGSAPGTRTVTFDAAQDGPTGSATAVLAAGTEDTSYIVTLASLTAGFTDADGDDLSVANLVASNGAGVVDNLDGTWTITPLADFNGQLTLDYTVEDGNGGSVAGHQTVNFQATNDGPTAVNDTGALDEGQSVAFDVLANDSDIDVGDTLSVLNPVVTSANGTAIVDIDGNLLVTYTGPSLNEGETGQIVISYDASDGAVTDAATLTVTVTGVYDDGDDIIGGNTGETLTGSEVGETILGEGGNDTILGLGGDDVISGGSGADIIRGGDGDDLLKSGSGADKIFGGLGNDTIVGWGGNDRLTGDGGADVFVFHIGDGKDVITDFDTSGADRDRIDLSAIPKFDNFADVRNAMEMQSGDAVINIGGSNSIRLHDVDMADLSRIHFIF